jgi:hypothetical protein
MTRCAILRSRFIFAACFALFLAARPAAATIDYKISLAHPEKHAFQVAMRVPVDADQRADRRDLIVALPAWNALYQVRDFAYRVRDVRIGKAATGGAPVVPYKLDKQTWRIPASAAVDGSIEIEYSISWDEAGPFNSQLNTHHAFVNFAEVLMYVPDRRAENIEVKFTDLPSDWRSIAELPSGSAPNSFTSESYDKLVDAPVEIGKFEEFEFDNAGAHFRVVVDSRDWNRATLEDSLKRITSYEVKLMGGPPFKEYTFFFHIGTYPDAGGGGMEHANCTAIGGSYCRARILSCLERETHPAAKPRASGLHERAVFARPLVCRGSDEHLRLVHARAQRHLDERQMVCRPRAASLRAPIASGPQVAERRGIEPRYVVR